MRDVRVKKIIVAISIIIISLSSCFSILAESRDIYPGDLITINISSSSYSLEELEESFDDFEIIESIEKEQGYQLTLRTFEPGEYKVILADKEIELVVKSTLEEIDRDGIFQTNLEPIHSNYSPIWNYFFYLIIGLIVILSFLLIKNLIKNLKKKNESPYQRAIRKLTEININEDSFFVKLSLVLKEYLENTFLIQVRGKSTVEIMTKLSEISVIGVKNTEIREWLNQADYYKFTSNSASDEIKKRQQQELKNILTGLEEIIQEKNEG
ncbi:MAG: hypothetical protein ACOCQO_03170 [Halanaerobiaceae bacterium]